MEFHHVTVLLDEMINYVVKPGGLYVDMTLGGGGHSSEVLRHGGRLIGIDRDAEAIDAAQKRLSSISNNFTLVKNNFKNIESILGDLGVHEVDGFIMDLGVSSHQIDEPERGFSYMKDAPLDMRMDTSENLSAFTVVNTYSEDSLFKIISQYGEEHWAKRIAEFIVNKRKIKPIETTSELVSVIEAAIPKGARTEGSHVAKRTFQAIRIEVNDELRILEKTVKDAVSFLKPGGRIGVITFHSLEDRIIKNTFASLVKGCICPSEFPVCVCGIKPSLKNVTKHPVLPSENELKNNPRSRSAKLRVAEKI